MSIRDDFFENKAVAALWDVAVSIKRGNPLPLDSNSVFKSYADLETYASGPLSYPGQIIAVVNENSTEIYYLDQNLSIKAVGSIPTVDNKSIEVVDGVLSVYNFGSSYYKYINEEKDENGEIISAAHYEKVESSTENPWKVGLEPKVVEENGEYVIGWYEPNPATIEGVKSQLTTAQETIDKISEAIGEPQKDENTPATGFYFEFDKKADKVSVYTKTEVDQLIASADHLKRKIFNSIEFAQAFIEDNPDTATQYIYMIPSGLQLDSNRYYEYMLIDNQLEQVGNWEVSLDDYFTEDELKTYLNGYYTETEVDAILADYAKSSVLEGYYTSEQVDQLLSKEYTKEEIDNLLKEYIKAETGKNLISDAEIAKLATVKENAEPNFIKTVTSDFKVNEAGQLSLVSIKSSQIFDLQDELNKKVDTKTSNFNGVETEWILLSPENQAKLNALVIGEEGVEISGKVNADNVEGLGSWIITNRNTIAGLYPTEDASKLKDIEVGAQANFIKSVNTDEFTVNEGGFLTINKISVNNIANLDSKLPGFTKVSNDFVIEEDTLKLANTYVKSSVYLAEVGDLTQLIRTKDNSTIVEEINYINERLQWADLV